MTRNTAEIAADWDRGGCHTLGGSTFNELHKKLNYLQKTHYQQYVPTLGVEHPDYDRRLEEWLMSAESDEDRQLMFEFASEITFFTREDFTKLYQAAFVGPITRWIVDLLGLPFSDPSLSEKATDALLRGTWYCPMSDSMPIADFHHANAIGGIQHRPDWRSIAAFGDRSRVQDFMKAQSPELTRIVILEDFIGAGWQLREKLRTEHTSSGIREYDVVSFTESLGPIACLFVPLVICPEGARVIRSLVSGCTNVRVEPVLEIRQSELISPVSVPASGSIHGKLFDLVGRLYPKVEGDRHGNPLYGPYGNGTTGARIVMYSNTPAGTLPIIQHRSNTWTPLFPRSARVK